MTRVVIDFDGTIAQKQPGFLDNPGPLMPGVKEAIDEFKKEGYYIVISSCRNNKEIGGPVARARYIRIMTEYLTKYSIPFDEIDNGEQGKVIADLYIGDEAVGFRGNWTVTREEVRKRIGLDQVARPEIEQPKVGGEE